MAVTHTTTPQFPIPGLVKLNITLTNGGNFFRLWVTDAPEGSSFHEQLGTGLQVENAADDPSKFFEAAFDRGGAYTFKAQEYQRGASTHGGTYQFDPNTHQTETKIGAENFITVYIGQRIESKLGAQPYGEATLVLWVWNDTIRATTVKVHGELTPVIINPTTDRARTSALSLNTLAALGTLPDVTASSAIGNLSALLDSMRTVIPLHFNNIGADFHAAVDNDNDTEIESIPADPSTPEGFASAAATLIRRLRQHITNHNNERYHVNVTVEPDWTNVPIASAPGGTADMAIVMIAFADVFRSYEAHRVDATAHEIADALNPITSVLADLLELHRVFLNEMRTMDPTNPTTMNSALTLFVHTAGFKEVPTA